MPRFGILKTTHKKETRKHFHSKCFRASADGAGDRARTGTLFPTLDFKSKASANSATPAGVNVIFVIPKWTLEIGGPEWRPRGKTGKFKIRNPLKIKDFLERYDVAITGF